MNVFTIQKKVLKELHRVLKKDGIFAIGVPGKHFFSFLDMGNWKFVFPKIHRFFYELTHSKKEYFERYIECKNGLIGDIEVEKRWHQHFEPEKLEYLLQEIGFHIFKKDGYGFWNRPLINLKYFMPKVFHRAIDRLIEWDSKKFHQTKLFFSVRK